MSLLSDIGKATASVLEHASETVNRYVYVNSFFVSQNEILAAFEKASGSKWEISRASAAQTNKIGKEKLLQGDFSGFVPAIQGMLFGGHEWVHHRGADNKLLGLSRDEGLDSVVAKIFKGEVV